MTDRAGKGGHGYPQAAGGPGGPPLRPSHHFWVPKFVTFSQPELDALLNRAGNPLAIAVYAMLVCASNLAGKYRGHALVEYQTMQSRLRAPKPERGAWPAAPSRKAMRTALDVLEAVGLVERDKAANKAQGQLRVYLPKRDRTGAP